MKFVTNHFPFDFIIFDSLLIIPWWRMFIYVCHFSFKLSFARGFYCKQRKYLRKIQIQLIRIYTFFALILMLSSNNAMLDFQLLGGIRIFSSIDSCSVGLLYYFLFFSSPIFHWNYCMGKKASESSKSAQTKYKWKEKLLFRTIQKCQQIQLKSALICI